MPDSTPKTRKPDGRWKPGASGNPTGRPISNPARRLLADNSEKLVQAAIDKALGGDTAALNVCLSRILPAYRPTIKPVELNVDPSADLVEIGRQVVSAVAAGDCPPDVAGQLLQGLGTLARITEIEELKDRLAALETAIKSKKGAK